MQQPKINKPVSSKYEATDLFDPLQGDGMFCGSHLKCGKIAAQVRVRLDNLSQQSVIQRKFISELNNKVIKARDKLIKASRSKMIIEKLQDKKFEQYNQDLLKQENKVVG